MVQQSISSCNTVARGCNTKSGWSGLLGRRIILLGVPISYTLGVSLVGAYLIMRPCNLDTLRRL